MRTRIGLIAVLAAIFVSSAFASEDWPGEAGKSDSVKSLPGRDFENARTAGMPLIVYFFDPNARPNNRSRYVEPLLGNLDFRSKLKDFLMLKIRTDGTDVRGWPAEFRDPAVRSASVVFISSDFKQIISFDKNMQNAQITLDAMSNAAASILVYEKSLALQKGGAKKEEPKAVTPVIEASKVPGLSDKDKKATAAPAKRKPTTAADE